MYNDEANNLNTRACSAMYTIKPTQQTVIEPIRLGHPIVHQKYNPPDCQYSQMLRFRNIICIFP